MYLSKVTNTNTLYRYTMLFQPSKKGKRQEPTPVAPRKRRTYVAAYRPVDIP